MLTSQASKYISIEMPYSLQLRVHFFFLMKAAIIVNKQILEIHMNITRKGWIWIMYMCSLFQYILTPPTFQIPTRVQYLMASNTTYRGII